MFALLKTWSNLFCYTFQAFLKSKVITAQKRSFPLKRYRKESHVVRNIVQPHEIFFVKAISHTSLLNCLTN